MPPFFAGKMLVFPDLARDLRQIPIDLLNDNHRSHSV